MLTLGLSLVPRVVSVTLGPACRRPSRPVVQLEELLLVCVCGTWMCYVVTGMVQVPVCHCGVDRRPSNRPRHKATMIHPHTRESLAWRLCVLP